MDENRHTPPDGQDQMGTEIKKTKAQHYPFMDLRYPPEH